MAETNLAFSKIVSTPTLATWSQAYSAGRLFAAFSLATDIIPAEGDEHLASIGKDLISTLESEFFTLENKDLDSIKRAILTSFARINEGIASSFVLCYLSDNVLYLFASGGSKAVLKRKDKIGTVLEGEEGTNLKSASGYVQDEDIIVLQTKPFLRIIPSSTLASALDRKSPEEIAEDLAPHVHEKAEGGASAVILTYKEGHFQDIPVIPDEEPISEDQTKEEDQLSEEAEKEEEEVISNISSNENENQEIADVSKLDEPMLAPPPPVSPFLTDQMPRKKRFSFSLSFGFMKRFGDFSKQRKTITIVAVVLIILILITSFLALNSKKSSQSKTLFSSVYSQAKSKYDEGQSLKDLNATLSQQSFKDAKSILDSNKDKFSANSPEEKQILELLDLVDNQISSSNTQETTSATEVKTSESAILGYEINNSGAFYFVQNDDNVFFLDGTGISSIDKGNDKKSQIVKKSWKTDGGIGLFGSNLYILDKNDGILKFVGSTNSYTKADYFPDSAPDLTTSADMAIDGSIFILFKDGHIEKYTKAKKDTFGLSGLDIAFSNPSKIFTNADTDNLYVLDNANSRIIELDKTGKFKNAYSANILKDAKDFEVVEKDKKIFVLSNGKVWEITIK